jgi:hypothetical protein
MKIFDRLKTYPSFPVRKRWSRRYLLDYLPESGIKSEKAERLAKYCLGDFADTPVPKCTRNSRYLKNNTVLLLKSRRGQVILSAGSIYHLGATDYNPKDDQKKVVKALISQRSKIPFGINCWLTADDSAGIYTDPNEGLHITGVRPATRRDLVLVPTSNRERFTGANLKSQMDELRSSWVPWEEKTDTVWWGGALTGDQWRTREPRPLTRREVLLYFHDQPSNEVSLNLTEIPAGEEDLPNIKKVGPFTKKSAFGHKCILLLPGNDIASGSSWYFAGNSVVLMPPPHLEHILYFELNPWKHYVPVENDPADILVKLRWVLENPDKAKRIVKNSHERLRWLCGPEYLWACNEVLLRIS